MTRSLGLSSAVLALAWACSGSEKPAGIGLGNSAGSTNVGGQANSGGRSNATGGKGSGRAGAGGAAAVAGAGQAGTAGELGGAGFGTAGSLSAAGEPGTGLAGSGGGGALMAPTCDPNAAWSTSTALASLNTAAKEVLLDVTQDERSIVWLSGEGQNRSLLRAERSLASDNFGAPQTVAIPLGYDPGLGAALSPDGLRLILVASAGSGFAELTRSSRAVNFDPTPSTAAFETLNLIPQTAGQSLSSPVLNASQASLYYVGTMQISNVYQSHLSASSWGIGTLIGEGTLAGSAAKKNLLSAVSADGLTFFYFNEADNVQQARFRESLGSPLYQVVDLAQMKDARPNSTCTHLYYTKGDSGSGDLYFATKD